MDRVTTNFDLIELYEQRPCFWNVFFKENFIYQEGSCERGPGKRYTYFLFNRNVPFWKLLLLFFFLGGGGGNFSLKVL